MGLGIVKIANYVVRPYLESGELSQVLPDWTAEHFPVSVMYPKSGHVAPKVRVFIDWVSELFEKNPLLQTGARNARLARDLRRRRGH